VLLNESLNSRYVEKSTQSWRLPRGEPKQTILPAGLILEEGKVMNKPIIAKEPPHIKLSVATVRRMKKGELILWDIEHVLGAMCNLIEELENENKRLREAQKN